MSNNALEKARQEYADRYAQEHFLRDKADQVHGLLGQWNAHTLLLSSDAIEIARAFLGVEIDVDGMRKTLEESLLLADWLVAEAKWHRLRAEALLLHRESANTPNAGDA